MYMTDLTHVLDESGGIPKSIPKEARELASFLALVIDGMCARNGERYSTDSLDGECPRVQFTLNKYKTARNRIN